VVRWYILDESERLQSGNFVTVAVAFNDLEATLVRDYLRERRIYAHTPPFTPFLYPPLQQIYVWVPRTKVQQAVEMLKQLASEWQEEPTDDEG
jgi:hypothetical protein